MKVVDVFVNPLGGRVHARVTYCNWGLCGPCKRGAYCEDEDCLQNEWLPRRDRVVTFRPSRLQLQLCG